MAVPGMKLPSAGTAVWVTTAATWTQSPKGLHGYSVQRPERNPREAVTTMGQRRAGLTRGTTGSPGR